MIKLITLLVLLSVTSHNIFAENLMDAKIRRISTRKKSVYLSSGVFHNGGPKVKSKLKAVRQSYSNSKGYERLVFDFETDDMPRVYGYISKKRKKLYLDLFETEMTKAFSSFGNSKYVESINLFPIQNDVLSVEIIFKKNIALDVFSLKSKARLVIDLKE
jgi:hypothetical protein